MTIAKTFLSLAFALAAATAQAGVTYTSAPINSTLSSLGVPNTTTYGQVFTVPADGNKRLDSFSFFLAGDLSRAYGGVAAWTGTGAGPELFKSAYFNAAFAGFTEVSVDTGGLDLDPGQQYIAYFSTYGIENSGADQIRLGTGSAVQDGVSWDNAGGGSPNHEDWNGAQNNGFAKFAGSMSFSEAANVPEPGSLALLGLGLGALGMLRARRRTAA